MQKLFTSLAITLCLTVALYAVNPVLRVATNNAAGVVGVFSGCSGVLVLSADGACYTRYTALDIPIVGGGFQSVASTTYHFVSGGLDGNACSGFYANYFSIVVPVTGTITELYVNTAIGTPAAAGNVTFTLRLSCSDTTLVATQSWASSNPAVASDVAHTQAVTKGDLLQLKVVTPAWASPPVNEFLNWGVKIASPS